MSCKICYYHARLRYYYRTDLSPSAMNSRCPWSVAHARLISSLSPFLAGNFWGTGGSLFCIALALGTSWGEKGKKVWWTPPTEMTGLACLQFRLVDALGHGVRLTIFFSPGQNDELSIGNHCMIHRCLASCCSYAMLYISMTMKSRWIDM